jgi:LPS-assembly lipoprotein
MSWSERRRVGPGRCVGGDAESGRRSASIGLLAGLAVSSVLAGCGFHLRGDVTYVFPTVYINAPPNSPIVAELRRAIDGAGGTHVVAAAKDATVTLDVTSVTDDKQVLTLSSGGRVSEYQLTKHVGFSLHDSEGHDWLPAAEITVRRAYTFNESEVLAREAEETRMLKEMQTDAVQQIVRRLQAAKKPA